MRFARRLLTAATAALLLLPVHPPASAHPTGWCTDRTDNARKLTIPVKKQPATGRYALPRERPRELVVFMHGYGHTSASWAHHMRRFARKHGVIAVGMDYRGLKISPDSNGDGLPESRGFRVLTGAHDSIAAARLFLGRCPSIQRVILYSVSGGSAPAGVALAMHPKRANGKPLFDHWINIEGMVNATETYFEARAAGAVTETAKRAQADWEEECGGTFEERPNCYLNRTVVARADEVATSGVRGVVFVHGVDDGLVPYNQSRELSTLLAAQGVPIDFFTVGRRSARSEQETTITGYVGSRLDEDYKSPLAGHGSEKSTTHIVIVTGFQRLAALLRGQTPGPYREFLVDGEAGTFPSP